MEVQAARECRRQAQGWRQALAVHGAPLSSGPWTDAASRDAGPLVQSGPGGHRAAPGIEPGTSRALNENHATRPSSHVGMLESMHNSALPASVGHLRGLHTQDAGVRWRCKLPASAAVKLREGGRPWQSMVPRCPVGRGRMLQVRTLDRWSSRVQGATGLLRELNPGPLAP